MGLFGKLFSKGADFESYENAQKRFNELNKEINKISEKLSIYKHGDTSREKGRLVNTLADLRLEQQKLLNFLRDFEKNN